MQHEYHCCPVTALAYLRKDVLLAGEGNYLKIYDTNGNEDSQSVKVFESQAIHGIIVYSQTQRGLLIWGGRSLRFGTFTKVESQFHGSLEPVLTLDDWILDAAFRTASDTGGGLIAIVTAHNALWIARHGSIQWAEPGEELINTSLQRAVSGSNCILYSAHIQWLSASHCLIASGTAFGDVILWSSFFDKGGSARSQIHFTFSAHEGSVFGVQISSLVRIPGVREEKRLLATCSDDRTIRLWDISDFSAESPTLTQVQRDTGFGSRPDKTAHAPPLLAKVMGHTSRIWHVRFLHDTVQPDDVNPKLLSCGEDAVANVWRVKPHPTDLPYELELIDARSSHSGKNIWSAAHHSSGSLATGGADGAIARYSKRPCYASISEIPRSLLHTDDTYRNDNYKAYTFVSNNTFISTTELGRVLLVTFNGDRETVKELSPPLHGLRGYSVAVGLEGTAFVSGTDGTIYCYTVEQRDDHEPELLKLLQRPGKTAGLFASRLEDCKSVCLLATGVGHVATSLYTLQSGLVWPPFENDRLSTCHLALPEGTVVTSFATHQRDASIYALVGSRNGSILIYKLNDDASLKSLEPMYIQDKVHGEEAVTALLAQRRKRDNYIFSSGRDGTLAIHRVSLAPDKPSMDLVHQLALPLGPNIEGLYMSSVLGILYAWGFRGKHFIHYDMWKQQEILSVECGGAHRNWAFRPTTFGAGGSFVWTKASTLYEYTQVRRLCHLTSPGGHGREIKAVAVSKPLANGEEMVATGAEDTDIKLFRVQFDDQDFGKLKCSHTIRKHNTGIQHLAWDGEYLFSSGGFEEFFVWKVTLEVPCFYVGVVCESQHPRSGKSDLRVCGFDARRLEGDRNGHGGGETGFEILMAYSDSSLKLWRYWVGGGDEGGWELMKTGDYLTSCLTHVQRLPTGDASESVIVTAATDGHLAHWTLNDRGQHSLLTWRNRHKIHQSAVHALTSTTLSDGSTLIATGGDDNAVAFTRMASSGRLKTLIIPRAHAAAVTGLALLTNSKSKKEEKNGKEASAFWLVSASIDQRIKIWRVCVDGTVDGIEGVEVEEVHDVYTSVADVSSLAIRKLSDGAKGVVVCGVGMDVWRLPLDDEDGQKALEST